MIEMCDVSFRYREGAAPVVRDVNLTIPDGAFVGIAGAAGSGKSTLAYAMNGIVPHRYPGDFYGVVRVQGRDTVETSLTDLSRLVGSVCQDIDSQMVSSVVEDEVLYGLENFGVPHDEIAARVDGALADMGIADLRDRTIASLSGGQKQKVAIASVVALKPAVLVLDEPTAELDPASSRSVFDLLRRYAREHGTTVVVVEQKIALLSSYADMLVVMGGGRVRFADVPAAVLAHSDELLELGVSCPRSTTLSNRLRAAGLYAGPVCRGVDEACEMVAEALGLSGGETGRADAEGASGRAGGSGRPAESEPPVESGFAAGPPAGAEAPASFARPPRSEPPSIEFRGVHASYDGERAVLRGADFVIGRGEFVALVGTNGAGKSTALRLMNGLLKPARGTVLVNGVSTEGLKTSQLARTVGFLFQNPDRQICCNTVRDELLFGFKALGMLGPEAERRVDAIAAELGLGLDDDPFLLNRGARQLLALASIVVMGTPVVLLDEPTCGLDYLECARVMGIVGRLHRAGATIVMVCHDMEVVGDYAERVIVMGDGLVMDDGPAFEVLRRPETLARASLMPPQISDIALELARRHPVLAGTPVAGANTVDDMVAAVERLAGTGALAGTRVLAGMSAQAPAAVPMGAEGRGR